MIGNNLLDKVKVLKDELLGIMKKNREQHAIDVKELMLSRHNEVKAYFSQMLEKMQSDPEFQPSESINFPVPVDNTASYDRAIKMVEMSIDQEVELTEHQFDKLVMDNWEWKHELLRTSQFFGKQL